MAQIVLVSGEPYCLDESCDVIERYRFGDDLGGVLIEGDGDVDDESVVHVEPTFEAGFRIADYVSDAAAEGVFATVEDVRAVSNVPDRGTTGDGVRVVVMDSGVDAAHPAFEGTEVRRVDVTGTGTGDRVGHGTGTAGQIARIAPDASLTSLKIFPDEGSTRTKYILRAYEWLLRRADEVDAVNMSWGAQKDSETLNRLQNRLVSAGVRDVTAAGNTGEEGGSPATARRAFSVGACTEGEEMAPFSSYDPGRTTNPEVVAVGVDTRLARADGTSMGTPLSEEWTVASGTSFAAPAVAGMTARYLERRPDAAPAALKEDFAFGARDIPGTERDAYGIADYERTVTGVR